MKPLQSPLFVSTEPVLFHRSARTQTVGRKLEAGETGLSLQDEFDGALFINQLCGRVSNFKANAYLKIARISNSCHGVYGWYGGIRLALDEANLHNEHIDPDKFGVIVGAGLALGQSKDLIAGIRQSFENDTFSSARFGEVGMRAINPLWLLKGLSNNVLGFATAELDARGFNQNYCNSGISGLQAIAEALGHSTSDVLKSLSLVDLTVALILSTTPDSHD